MYHPNAIGYGDRVIHVMQVVCLGWLSTWRCVTWGLGCLQFWNASGERGFVPLPSFWGICGTYNIELFFSQHLQIGIFSESMLENWGLIAETPECLQNFHLYVHLHMLQKTMTHPALTYYLVMSCLCRCLRCLYKCKILSRPSHSRLLEWRRMYNTSRSNMQEPTYHQSLQTYRASMTNPVLSTAASSTPTKPMQISSQVTTFCTRKRDNEHMFSILDWHVPKSSVWLSPRSWDIGLPTSTLNGKVL